MNNEDKQTFTAPLLTLTIFDQKNDTNTASTLDVWSIGKIKDISQ